jgi:hypothetical protein
MSRRLLHCSFCGKDETQVSKLVAGPKVYICDACVATAREIMNNSADGDDSTPRVSMSRWRRLLGRIVHKTSRGDVRREIHTGNVCRT